MSDTHPIHYSRPRKLVEAEEAIAAENAKATAGIFNRANLITFETDFFAHRSAHSLLYGQAG